MLDTREIQQALRDTVLLFKKNGAKELNKRAGNVAMKAAGETPKAKRGKITRDLRRKVGGGFLGKKVARRAGITQRATPLQYHLINAMRRDGRIGGNRQFGVAITAAVGRGHALTGDAMSAVRMKFQDRAIASIAYVSAGFLRIAQDFGRSTRYKVSHKGLAGRSVGTLATESKLTATMENMARGAEKIALSALQRAIDREAADMSEYSAKEILSRSMSG